MMNDEETIAAIATPLGEGGLGVVRLSGPLALPIADQIFSTPKISLQEASTHTLHHGHIQNGKEIVDEAVVSIYRAPRSYTGEDVVEFSCHGSPVVLKEVLELCQRRGARLAKPGEFTQRAFLNGKLDLSQAEAVADLIAARSSSARQAASGQLLGTLSEKIKKIRLALVDLVAHLEANLDFVEEDIPNLSAPALRQGLSGVSNEIDQLLSTSLRGRVLRDGVRVTLVGKPNV